MANRVDANALRRFMRRVPSPVAVVTAAFQGKVRGITIGSFTSTSLHPPLISFNVGREARIYEALTQGDHFAVHVMHDAQADLPRRFAVAEMTGEEQFDQIEVELDVNGTPILTAALAVLSCRLHAVYDAGDHSIVLGRVTETREEEAGHRPLVYYDHAYRRVGRVVREGLLDPIADGGSVCDTITGDSPV